MQPWDIPPHPPPYTRPLVPKASNELLKQTAGSMLTSHSCSCTEGLWGFVDDKYLSKSFSNFNKLKNHLKVWEAAFPTSSQMTLMLQFCGPHWVPGIHRGACHTWWHIGIIWSAFKILMPETNPKDSILIGLGCSPGTEIFKVPMIIPVCNQRVENHPPRPVFLKLFFHYFPKESF